jgi:two-component system sensor histidine kinase KdpD
MSAPLHPASTFSAGPPVIGLCALTTAVTAPLLGHLDLVNIALVYVLAVAISALRWGRGAGILASVLAVVCFDFFFVPPRYSFDVEQTQYLLTFAVMLAVSLVISHHTGALAAQTREAESRAAEAKVLQHLACNLSGAVDLAAVHACLANELQSTLRVGAVLFLDDGTGHVRSIAPVSRAEAAPGALEFMVAQGVHSSGEGTGHGTADVRPDALALFVPLARDARRYGVLEMWAADEDAARLPKGGFAEAIAVVVRNALERAASGAVVRTRQSILE